MKKNQNERWYEAMEIAKPFILPLIREAESKCDPEELVLESPKIDYKLIKPSIDPNHYTSIQGKNRFYLHEDIKVDIGHLVKSLAETGTYDNSRILNTGIGILNIFKSDALDVIRELVMQYKPLKKLRKENPFYPTQESFLKVLKWDNPWHNRYLSDVVYALHEERPKKLYDALDIFIVQRRIDIDRQITKEKLNGFMRCLLDPNVLIPSDDIVEKAAMYLIPQYFNLQEVLEGKSDK